MPITPDQIEAEIQETIVMDEHQPVKVRTRVKAFLAGIPTDEATVAAVYNHAREVAHARHMEFSYRDEDMERVIAVMDAQLDPMIEWLENNGLSDARRFIFDTTDGWRM